MKSTFIIAFFIALFFQSTHLLADSPLTSTPIHIAYEHETIVKTAADANGILTAELAAYLADDHNPVDLKVAVINQLGWDINGKNNADIFLAYLTKEKKFKNQKRVLKKASGSVLISLAYLKALDNYFEVDEAITIADKALKKSKKSYTIHLIAGLIKAQKAMSTSFCHAYRHTHEVLVETSLKKDLKEEANKIIFDYMDLYKEGC